VRGARRLLTGAALALSAPAAMTFTVAGCAVTVPLPTRSPGMVDEFFEPGPLHVFRPAPPPVPSWGPEPKRLQPLNALGARVATLALRMGLARLLELRPATDDARRWGVAIRRTKRERIMAALDTMREDAMIAAAVKPLREEYGALRRSMQIQDPPVSFDELGIPFITKPTEAT